MTKTALMTAACALAMYDAAMTPQQVSEAAAAMAVVLRAKAAPRVAKAPVDRGGALTVATLAPALKRAAAVSWSRAPQGDICGTVRLIGADNELRLSTTDLDSGYFECVPAPGIFALDTCVNARDLERALKGAAGDVSLSMQGAELRLEIGGAVTLFPTRESGDFPIACFDQADSMRIDIDGARLVSRLSFIAPCISTEETRYYLNGAFFHVPAENDGRLTIVATDGHRLRLDTGAAGDEAPANMPEFILPTAAVAFLIKHAPKTPGAVAMRVSDSMHGHAQKHIRVAFTFPNGARYVTKAIDGSFPKYQRVVPRNAAGHGWRVDHCKDFGATVARIGAATNQRQQCVKFTITGALLFVEGKNLEGGAARSGLPAAAHTAADGGIFEIGFNARYVVDMFSEPGALVVSSPNDPAMIRFDQEGRIGVLMPLRV